jgi:hypothetical protein
MHFVSFVIVITEQERPPRAGLSSRNGEFIVAVAERAQGFTIKSQLRRNNGTDEQGFGCDANGRRAHVPGGTNTRSSTRSA